MNLWLTKSADKGIINSFIKMTEIFAEINPEEKGDNELDFYIKNNSLPILSKSFTGIEMIDIEEILKIEKIGIDDKEFKVPEGFKEMDMSEMIKQGFE